MKKNSFFLSVFILSLFYSCIINAQENDHSSRIKYDKEVIIGIPGLNANDYDNITKGLQSKEGIKLKYFCFNHDLIVLVYDPDRFANKESIAELFKTFNPDKELFLKVGEAKDLECDAEMPVDFMNIDAKSKKK